MKSEFDRICAPCPDPALLDLVIPTGLLAMAAGARIMRHYGQPCPVAIKDDSSPVTLADHESNDVIVAGLMRLTPGIAVVSEENNDDVTDAATARYWTVDPLDGTREFIDQTGGFCVKIALIAQGRPVLGVIYCPVQDVLYTGVAHGLAIKIVGDAPPQTIRTRPAAFDQNLSVLFNRKHADPALYEAYRATLAPRGIVLPADPDIRPGLPRSLQVAEGLADIHAGTGIQTGSGYIWDIAADDLILTNAGGAFYALPDGGPMPYGPPRAPVPHYLAVGDRRFLLKP